VEQVLKFVGEFVEEIRRKQTEFSQLLGLDDRALKLESELEKELNRKWCPLPTSKPKYSHEYAIDSSSASRSLSNGIEFFITRALMLGTGNFSEPMLRFEMIKGSTDYSATAEFERIQRDLMEIQIITENMDKVQDDSIVLIDGNLYGRYTHLLNQINIDKWRDLPLELIKAMQDLYRICQRRSIMLVGVSKFSKTRVLTAALKRELGYGVRAPEYLDVELLYRWKLGETGYTRPLMLGTYAIKNAASITKPSQYRKNNFSSIQDPERQKWATDIIREFPSAPAIVMFHMIPKAYAQPMRIDIPASCLGITSKVMEVNPFEFIEPELVEPVVSQLVSDFGGRDVYNALLYIVDREVRLGGKAVDTVYKSVLGNEMGITLDYDRSSRRFTF